MKSPKGWLLSRFFEIREKIEEASDRLSRVDLGNNWIIFFVATLNLAAIVLFEALNYLARLPTVVLIAIASELVFWSCSSVFDSF